MADTEDSQDIGRRAEQIYADRLKSDLERSHLGEFLAIEPESETHFLGRTLSEAIGAARHAHPDRLVYALRIGEETAL
jgi:hypothetical protein